MGGCPSDNKLLGTSFLRASAFITVSILLDAEALTGFAMPARASASNTIYKPMNVEAFAGFAPAGPRAGFRKLVPNSLLSLGFILTELGFRGKIVGCGCAEQQPQHRARQHHSRVAQHSLHNPAVSGVPGIQDQLRILHL